MKGLLRHVVTAFAASILAVVLGTGTALPDSMVAQAQMGTTWNIHSETNSSTTTTGSGTTENWSSSSDQTSDDGQSFTDNQSFQSNPDGSRNEHENFNYNDGKGGGGSFSRDENRDSKGNRKVHKEEKIRKNGKCEIVITDEEYDKNNKLIKRDVKTLPCGEYSLEWSREGTFSGGGITTQYGPDTAIITLARDGRTHVGSYVGQFHGTISGKCQGRMVLPISVQVTAKEDEFEDLDFTVEATSSQTSFIACPQGGGGPTSTPPVTFTRTFHLPAREGASQGFSVPGQSGQVTDKFTLRKRDE